MDQGTLVENQIDDGRRLVEQLAAAGINMTAAFWVRPSEDGEWTLYIASKLFDEKGPAAAYRAIHDALRQLDDPWISLSEIKVIGAENPITKDLLSILERHPRAMATRSRPRRLGNLEVDEVYIYPPVSGSVGIAGKRKTRIVGKREVCRGGKTEVVEDEIGVVDGVIGEERFNKSYLRLITEKFGSIEAFASRYPSGYFQFLD